MDFVIANRAVHFYVYNNCVRPQPHRWWSNKIAARFGGCSEPQFGPCLDEDLDCGPVDLSAVPEGVPRVDPNDCIVTVVVCNTFGHIEQEHSGNRQFCLDTFAMLVVVAVSLLMLFCRFLDGVLVFGVVCVVPCVLLRVPQCVVLIGGV